MDIQITNEREALAYLTYATTAGDRAVRRQVITMGARAFARGIPNTPLWTPESASVAEVLAEHEANGIRFLIEGDPEFPEGLTVHEMGEHAPLGLWVRGTLPTRLGARGLAVIGARAATSYGEHVTSELISALPGTRVIVSGMAHGIDGAAHRTALACGKPTVAVLACGVDRAYPAGHTDLSQRIVASGGAIVSELPPTATPTRDRFLSRNRIIAGLTAGMLVVEAGFRSGSLNAAAWAERLGKKVMAVPGPVTSPASAGTHRLIADDRAQLVTSAGDIEEVLW